THYPYLPFLHFSLFPEPAPTAIYTLSLHDALPISAIIAKMSGSFSRSCDSVVTITCVSLRQPSANSGRTGRSIRRETSVSFSVGDRKSTRLNSSHLVISYAVFCLKKKKKKKM